MADKFTIDVYGLEEFRRAIARNPATAKKEIKTFLVRAIAVYKKLIIRNPWKVGGTGGGSPVDTQALRDSHQSGTKIGDGYAKIGPDTRIAKYAKYVHGEAGEINRRTGVKARPWLDYAIDKGKKDVETLQGKLIDNIVNDLAK